MSNNQIDVDKIVTHWISTSDADFQTMLNLFDTKDFHWALFMGHLVIENI
jgi:hypothetical protein